MTARLASVTCRVLLLLLVAAPASAELLRWVDEQGVTHFAQALFDVPPQYRDQLEESAGSGRFSIVEGLNRVPEKEGDEGKKSASSSSKLGGEILEALRAEGLDISTTPGFLFLLLVVPLGALGLFLTQKILRTQEESLATKSLIGAFFHRLGFGVAFWMLLLTGMASGAPSLLLAHAAVATAVCLFLFGNLGRSLATGLLFVVVDNALLAATLFGSTMLFA